MTSVVIPGLDLVPSLPSRVVTVDLVDMTEGVAVVGAKIDFFLPADLHVPADDKILQAGRVTLTLNASGHGEIRLPAYTDSVRPVDWVIGVKKHWAPHPYFIRVPAGSTKISLADIEPVQQVPAGLEHYLPTGVSLNVTEGAVWNGTGSLTGGIINLDLTVPPGGVAYPRPAIHSGDLDSINDVGTYPVGSLSVANRPPVEETGNLTVGLGGWNGGGRTQSFVTIGTPPKMFIRRRSSLSNPYGPWQRVAGEEALALIGALESRTATTVARRLHEPATNVITGKHSSIVPMSMSRDRRTLYATGVPFLRESFDFGATWTTVPSGQPGHLGTDVVESVTQMENGELIIVARQTSGTRRFWVTTGYGTADMTVEVTYTARNSMIYFPQEWATSFEGRVLVAAEYGPKYPSWQGSPVDLDAVAKHAWISLDYGHTWKNVFDLIPMLSAKMGLPLYYDDIHLHGAAWDPYWDRIWLTFGDSRDGVVYSDDLGETWKWAAFTNAASGLGMQSVGIIPMPNCVLFASDNADWAQVRRINRSEAKDRGLNDHYIFELAWRDTVPSKMFVRGKSRARRLRDDAPALFAWSADTAAGASLAVATIDGYSYQLLWRDDTTLDAGLGGRSIIGPTLNGKIYASIVGHPDGWRVIEMQATGY